MKKEFNKGDMVKVKGGPFKDFYGKFIQVVANEKGRIEVEMFGRLTRVHLYLKNLRKAIPKCRRCGEILSLTSGEMSNNILCKKCLNQMFNLTPKIK